MQPKYVINDKVIWWCDASCKTITSCFRTPFTKSRLCKDIEFTILTAPWITYICSNNIHENSEICQMVARTNCVGEVGFNHFTSKVGPFSIQTPTKLAETPPEYTKKDNTNENVQSDRNCDWFGKFCVSTYFWEYSQKEHVGLNTLVVCDKDKKKQSLIQSSYGGWPPPQKKAKKTQNIFKKSTFWPSSGHRSCLIYARQTRFIWNSCDILC